MLKLTCPLLAHPCIENRCAWWSSEHASCAAVAVLDELAARRTQETAAQSIKVKTAKKEQ